MSEEEKKLFEAIKYKNKHLFLVKVDADFLINLIENQQKELNTLKEIEQQHKTDNGLLRQELDMQIEHNKELEATLKQTQDSWFEDTQKIEQEKEKISDLKYQLYHKQQMIDELTQSEEKLKIELGKEKEKNKALEEIENKLMPLAECSYWDYEKHTCTHTCRGCDELSSDNRRSHSGILIDKDRYCRLYEDGYAEEDTRYVNVSDLIKRHCKLEEK